ncbi:MULTISPECIES: transposase [unclassified Cupriavidus]|uniref:transposase n=1 Tax=unclassified Cupriavidus TaxID=2640874 RepID=UPI0021008A7C|nr:MULTISPECIES: transposase [unclassified Cupriavidus]
MGNRSTGVQRFDELGHIPHLFHARADPRRRTHAVGIYTHVLDQHGIVYKQPMVLNERQAGVAIEGAMRHNETSSDGGLLRLAVDTHGYTIM